MSNGDAVVEALWEAHGGVLTEIGSCADGVAGGWDRGTARDRSAVVEPFEAALADRGIRAELPTVLETAVSTLGTELVASPVPAPPYVTVTSRGPVLRGTTPESRVVVTVAVFEPVENAAGYRRRTGVDVEVVVRDRVADRR